MNAQLNLDLSRSLKEQGRDRAASSGTRSALLEYARQIAYRFAANYGTITADDVRRLMGEKYEALGPAAGKLFNNGDFIFTGKFIESSYTKNHARLLRVWRLKERGRL